MLTRAATSPVWYGCVLSSHGESWAKYNLAEPIPLQDEYPLKNLGRGEGTPLKERKLGALLLQVVEFPNNHQWYDI